MSKLDDANLTATCQTLIDTGDAAVRGRCLGKLLGHIKAIEAVHDRVVAELTRERDADALMLQREQCECDRVVAERDRLREALRKISAAFGNTEYSDCASEDHFEAIHDIVRAALKDSHE